MNNGIQNKLADVKAIIDDRFSALDADLGQYIYSWSRTQKLSELPVLANVAEELRSFLSQRKGDLEQLDTGNSSSRDRHVKNTLLSVYIAKALADWQDIKRAAAQRGFYADRAEQTPVDTLGKADKLAGLCLNRAIDAGLIETPATPICYFDKNIAITESPYTSLPLISVPLTAIRIETDLYAVVHELGHYVFAYLPPAVRNDIMSEAGKDEYKQPYRGGKQSGQVSNWTEEIFADLFASLVGGPAYDKQFEEYLLSQAVLLQSGSTPGRRPINEFLRDDEDHPPIYLRPLLSNDNQQWEAVVNDILPDTLSGEENDQFAALKNLIRKQDPQGKGQAGPVRALCRFIGGKIAGVSGDSPVALPQEPYTGTYSYTPKTTFEPLGDLADFIREIQEWHREEWGSILRCC